MVQKTFRDLGLTKHIKSVLRLEPDPRHLQDAGDLRQPFTDLGFCGQPFNTAISVLTRVSGLFCTTKADLLDRSAVGLHSVPPLDGSVVEVQPTPDLYFYKSEMHPVHLTFAPGTPPILPLLRGGAEGGGVVLRK